ncbi:MULTISPECIES: Hsp20/alpha crystallin family protein [Pseudomonas]|uniref:Hsp20/alpha crystallin family protein n=1 Tax=Pseudomonas oryzicola TaxID=485876 RepID=A0ABS6QAQ9_9PSED|nr:MULTISPECIES: Hsp20/alpha crystallin family protein [Pseudomonas]MBV4491267.1 Hsp20/alpha crystallin family protein [Pseudomonas oryzicola]QXI49944.1 Hsp20/alpha crystallin family protein [Pseudomonas anuradhapurensis]
MSEAAKKVPVTPAATPAKAAPPSSEPADLWRPFQQLRRQIDGLFEDFGRRPLRMPFSHTPFDVEPFWRRDLFTHGMPAMDISEQAEEYRISAELPGVDDKDIEIKLVNGNLVIRGEKHQEVDEKRKEYHLSERHYGSFERVLQLPPEVDAEKINAQFAKGVLLVHLPKRAEAIHPEKVIPINSSK